MSTVATQRHIAPAHVQALGSSLPFDEVDTPGAYVCDWSGHLLRVTERAVTLGRAPALNIVGSAPLTVTKISDDPEVPITEAKRLAGRFKLSISF